IFRRADWSFDVKDHLAADAADGELALPGELSCSDLLNTGGRECERGKLFRVEEILALEMRITLTVACFDRSCVDGGLDMRVFVTRFINRQAPGDFGKVAFHAGDHHVLDLELCGRVNRVNAPRGCGSGRQCS